MCKGKTFAHHLARICLSWWKKQWDDNDGGDRQQRLQCGPGIALLSATAPYAMLTITAMASTARLMKIMMTLDGGVVAVAAAAAALEELAPVVGVAVAIAGADNNQQKAAAGVAIMAVMVVAGAERQWQWQWQRRLL